MNKRGRPKGAKKPYGQRDVVKQVRWTKREWVAVEQLAKEAGDTPCGWIRKQCLGEDDEHIKLAYRRRFFPQVR